MNQFFSRAALSLSIFWAGLQMGRAITYDFSGIVTEVPQSVGWVNPGQPFSGAVTFDPTMLAQFANQAGTGTFETYRQQPNTASALPFEVTLSTPISGVTPAPLFETQYLATDKTSAGDWFYISSTDESGLTVQLALFDPKGAMLSSGVHPTTISYTSTTLSEVELSSAPSGLNMNDLLKLATSPMSKLPNGSNPTSLLFEGPVQNFGNPVAVPENQCRTSLLLGLALLGWWTLKRRSPMASAKHGLQRAEELLEKA
jgi:hypothetical protein